MRTEINRSIDHATIFVCANRRSSSSLSIEGGFVVVRRSSFVRRRDRCLQLFHFHRCMSSTMSDSVHRNVPGARGGEQMSDSNKSVTKSETLLSAEPSHSRNSSWNVHDGLFNEMEGFPSVSIANQGNSVTSDDHVSAQCFEGTSSPVRGAGRGEARCASRRSLTPQKTGVRGVAVRLASCEKSRRRRRRRQPGH